MNAEVIAERSLTCIEDPQVTLTVTLDRPKLNLDTSDYECAYHIRGAAIDINRFAAGLDGDGRCGSRGAGWALRTTRLIQRT